MVGISSSSSCCNERPGTALSPAARHVVVNISVVSRRYVTLRYVHLLRRVSYVIDHVASRQSHTTRS